MFKRREQGWVSLNALLEIRNKISGLCNMWEDVFMVISSAFHAIKSSNVSLM
jgi:hypothetical protein